MDDDIIPEAKCLASLWQATSDNPTSTFVFPLAIQPDGSSGRWGSWWGCYHLSKDRGKDDADGGAVRGRGRRSSAMATLGRVPRRSVDEAVVHHDAIRQTRISRSGTSSTATCSSTTYIKRQVDLYPRKITRLFLRASSRRGGSASDVSERFAEGSCSSGAFGRLGIRYEVRPLQERELSPSGRGRWISNDQARRLRSRDGLTTREILHCLKLSRRSTIQPLATQVTMSNSASAVRSACDHHGLTNRLLR